MTDERMLTVDAALDEALHVAIGLDPTVVWMGGDRAETTAGLSERFGTARVRATPLSPRAVVGAAVGAAIAGYRPVVQIVTTDLPVCLDQITNGAATLRYQSGGQTSVPLVIRTSPGAEMGEAWLVHIPGLKVVVPATPADAKGLLLSAVFDDDPVVMIEPMVPGLDPGHAVPVPEGDTRVPLGRAVVRRAGTDLSVISYGAPVHDCLAVAETLARQGMSVEVVDLRSLVPLDEATVMGSVAKTKKAVVVHAAVQRAGFGAEVSSRIHEELFSELERPVVRVGGAVAPMPFAGNLATAHRPNRDRIEAALVAHLT